MHECFDRDKIVPTKMSNSNGLHFKNYLQVYTS